MYSNLTRVGAHYRTDEIKKQATNQQKRLLNIVTGTRTFNIDYDQYKKSMRLRRKKLKSKSVMRRNCSDYSHTGDHHSRMNKTFNLRTQSRERPISTYTTKNQNRLRVPSIEPVKKGGQHKLNGLAIDDEILQSLNSRSNRARRAANSIATESTTNSGGRISGAGFYTPKSPMDFPLTYYSENAQKNQKMSKMLKKMKKSRKRFDGHHRFHSSASVIQEERDESVTKTGKKKRHLKQRSVLKSSSKKSKGSKNFIRFEPIFKGINV